MADTIAAIATSGAVSAIGIVRISGDGAVAIADKMFRPSGGIKLAEAESRRMYYGEIIGVDGGLLDMCLCCVFRTPGSYTGEDAVEFHCHGSPVVLAEIMRSLYAHGARQAEAGEFTKRAFLNGRMDLTQAEAVIDLIQAETPAAARNAACQIRGAIGVRLEAMYSDLLNIMAHFHAAIDYPDEDIDEFEMQVYLYMLKDARDELRWMLSTHERGRVLREGIQAVIVGRPNTGKSSLLNALLGYSRVIVADAPGTTRDTIEEKIIIGNIPVRLIDTAGLRATGDSVEQLGVERTLDALRGAGLAILVVDGSEPLQEEDVAALHSIPVNIPTIVAVNKSDLPNALSADVFTAFKSSYCRISALTGDGLDKLEEIIKKALPEQSAPPDGELISNARQADAIMRARDGIDRAICAINASVTPDAVLTEIEAALSAIGETTGKTIREDITARIFERFCVGK
jgi:tRNA modification GTPase